MSISDLARITRLLSGWADGPGSTLGDRLAFGLAELVDEGELRPGSRIPSERQLAEALDISRGTVTRAYKKLRVEGRLMSRLGSGSRVLSTSGRPPMELRTTDGRLANIPGRREHSELDLSTGALPPLSSIIEGALDGLRPRLSALLRSDGYEPQGLLELREEVARYYDARGVVTSPDEITITTGSQQALQILCHVLLAPGDLVLAEDPTYRGALDLFRLSHAKVVPLPITDEGPDVAALERLVRRLRPRVIYLLPIAHNPTGYVTSEATARSLARVLGSTESMFVEDGSTADLVLESLRPPVPLGIGLHTDRWVAIGSLSKLFWGGLRVGWIRAAPAITQRILRVKTVADLGTSLMAQAVSLECMKAVDDARERRRAYLQGRLETVSDLLRAHVPEWSWRQPRGGSAIWVRVPGTDTRGLAASARRNGVSIVPGPFFSPIEAWTDHLRLPFGGDLVDLQVGIERLARTWRGVTGKRS